MHAGAKRALKIVVVDHHNFGVGISAHRAPLDVNLLDDVFIRILAHIDLRHPNERFLVLGNQKLIILLLAFAVEGDGDGIVIRKFAGARRGNADFHCCRNIVSGAQLALNALRKLSRRKLSRTAQTDQ